MIFKSKQMFALCAAIGCLSAGCTTVEKEPDVVTPGTTTIVHDKTPPPNVVVTPPASTSTHTETHTNTTDTGSGQQSTTTTTSTGGGQ